MCRLASGRPRESRRDHSASVNGVGCDESARACHLALDEAHRSQRTIFGEDALAATDGHRINDDSELVDQIRKSR